MNPEYITKISKKLSVSENQIKAVAELLEEGSTIPFIARYRKEATGSLDEIVITDIRNMLNSLKELDDRRETILNSLEKNGHLTDELKEAVEKAETMAVLEDIYLPYKPKRKTRASVAKEKGLEPLALAIFEQKGISPTEEAVKYINEENKVLTAEEALNGARDIIAEMVNENAEARAKLRDLFINNSVLYSAVLKGKEEEGKKFKDYFDWKEPLNKIPSHRLLAIRRGENEDILRMSIYPDEAEAIAILEKKFVKGNQEDSAFVKTAVEDAYKRLLSLSMETEARMTAKLKADAEAIKVFSENLRTLLLAPPLGAKMVMGIDPGFRTGCKVVCLDRQGKLLHYDTIFPNMNESKDAEAAGKLKKLCDENQIEAIAIGNGTASRETEAFVKKIDFGRKINVIVVNESGASIYSASETARKEFPDLDLTVRGSISIGRRLMDPLSELVKIDPKSIGVGQYQHDVDQGELKQTLDDVVESCVNGVGVDLNRASAELLTYVSGLGPVIARNIINYRNDNGAFETREDLKKIKGLGPKAFEQSAGFLRIPGGKVALDASAVHPESYEIVNRMAEDLNCSVPDLINKKELREKIDIKKYVTDTVGIPTLQDIMKELKKPGRDPRETFQEFSFAEGVEKIEDLKPGMTLPGIVTNVTAFGAFVDIGVHQDGLVHISELSDSFVKDPAAVVKVSQRVTVRVMEVDIERKRISLSMKQQTEPKKSPEKKNTDAGKVSENKKYTGEKKKFPKKDQKNLKNKKENPVEKKPEKSSSYRAFSDLLSKKDFLKK